MEDRQQPSSGRSGQGGGRLPALLAVAGVAGAIGTAYARTLAPGITWANGGADSGDLAAAAVTLGVAHPSGYPTYLLLAQVFLLLPLGEPAYRLALFSAVAAVLAALAVFGLVRELCAGYGTWALTAAGLAALTFGFAPLPWSQAVIAEVYTLNALFAALILWAALRRLRGGQPAGRTRLAEGALAGLALGNHLTVGLAVALWAAAAAWSLYAPQPGKGGHSHAAGWMRGGREALGLALGLAIYLYLPLRAAADPPVNWGDPRDWEGFWWVVSGAPYRSLAFGLPAGQLGGRVSAWAGLLLRQFGPAGVALGFAGLLYGARAERPFLLASALAAAGWSLFALAYSTADSSAYLIPAYLVFAIWIGLGAHAALAWVGARRSRLLAPAALTLALVLLYRAPGVAAEVDASHDRRASAFARAALAAAPPRAIVLTSGDRDTFPLWYHHFALAERPDVAVVVEPLLDFGWYRANLRATYPRLRLPETPGDGWREELAALNDAVPMCRVRLDAAPPVTCA